MCIRDRVNTRENNGDTSDKKDVYKRQLYGIDKAFCYLTCFHYLYPNFTEKISLYFDIFIGNTVSKDINYCME